MSQSVIVSALKGIGLSEIAVKVYLGCLGLGPVTKAEIASLMKISATDVDKAIEELKAKNLVVEVKSIPTRYQMIAPYGLFVAHLESFGKEFDAFLENIQKATQSAIQGTTNAIAQFREKLSEVSEKSLEEMRQSIKSLSEEFTKATVHAIEETSKNILENLTEATATSMESIKSAAESISEGMQKLSSETQKMMQSVIEQISASLGEMREGIMRQFESSMKVLSDALAKLIEQISAMLKKAFDDFQDQMKNTLETFRKSLEEMEQKTKSAMQEAGNKFAEETNKVISETTMSLNSKIEETGKRIEEAKMKSTQAMKESIEKLSSTISQETEKLGNRLSDTMKNTIEGLVNEVEKNANILREQIEKTLTESVGLALQQIKQALDRTKNLFSELYEEIRKKEVPAVTQTFFHIKGLEALKASLSDMLSRAKRVVYIAVADPRDLPWKKILELPERCRVYILTGYNPGHPEHRTIIQRLLKRPFMHIRRVAEPKIFAAEIDDKEGVLTMLTPGIEPNELDGIVVLSEPWAYLIKSIFMSEYSGAEEIRP